MSETVDTTATAPPAEESAYGAVLGHTNHRWVGGFLLVIAILFLVDGAVSGAILRTQLAAPDLSVLASKPYLQLMTLHGTFSFFLFLLPAWIGLAFAVVPLQLGAQRLALPRLAPLTAWLFVAAGVALSAAAFVDGGAPRNGWSMDFPVPIHGVGGRGVDLWILGVGMATAATMLGAVNLLTTVLRMRAPGMTLARLPMFTWSVLVSSAVLLLAAPVLLAGLVLLYVDHHLGSRIFDTSRGGDPLVWRTLFAFFAYPAMWATVFPALGVVTEVVPVFARTSLLQRRTVAFMFAAAGALAFTGWGSELAGDTAIPQTFFSVTSILILGPVALVMLLCLGTIALTRRPPAVKAPMVQALGLVGCLALAIPAMFVMQALATGKAGHNSQWWVGAWHLLLVGVSTFGLAAALYWWAPKLWGRHLNAGIGALQMLAMLGGVVVGFVPLLVVGAQGMVRRSTFYEMDSWGAANLVSTIGSYLLAGGVLLLVLNLLYSVVLRRGKEAEDDPWEAYTLEWATTSPPPPHNFDTLPDVRSDRPLYDLRHAEPTPPPPAEPPGDEPAGELVEVNA